MCHLDLKWNHTLHMICMLHVYKYLHHHHMPVIFQCAKRWKEIQQTHSASINSYPVLNSHHGSKNLSSFLNSVLHFTDEKDMDRMAKTQGMRQNTQPVTVDTSSLEGHNPTGSGQMDLGFVCLSCQ